MILGTSIPRSTFIPFVTHGGSRFLLAAQLVYDVLNRESFEAPPRLLEELENYVPPEVVKVVVGNKLDKVKSSPLITIILPADR